jgi:hypothetical protein
MMMNWINGQKKQLFSVMESGLLVLKRLMCYDIIDITPGTNSDFVKERSKDEFEEMIKYGSPIPDIDNSDIKELIMKIVKVFHV